jgi:fatty acid desaturase
MTDPEPRREPRPILERIGLAAVAAVLAVLFGGVAAASWIGGEPFLTIMGGVGCLMTVWVGLITLVRG